MKKFLLLFLLLVLFIIICATSYVNAVSNDISQNLFRLHVIANSDTKEDQDLKYLVRDNIIKYMNELSNNLTSKEDVIRVANENLSTIEQIAKETILQKGFNYDVSVEIGNFSFPTKKYGDITLPNGFYDALRVKIGEAKRSKLVVCNVSSFMFCRCNFWNCARIF